MTMRLVRSVFVVALCAACSRPKEQSLLEARRGFHTHLLRTVTSREPVLPPPPALFTQVFYPSAVGALPAYLSVAPPGGGKHPAIVWIHGGWPYDIDSLPWTPQPADNDQSASAFWKAGIVTLYPALRGAHLGIGQQEGQYGEVDDVLAAADFLKAQPSVDPERVYLGGHSTGGTLVLLASEMAGTRFRAVFSFGPARSALNHQERLTFDTKDPRELELRQPGRWLAGILRPTFVLEGTQPPSNLADLMALDLANHNPRVQFLRVRGGTHFSELGPMTARVAAKILADTGEAPIVFSDEELQLP